jgi:3D (Asp-Asp-Asp) domain-containing protein
MTMSTAISRLRARLTAPRPDEGAALAMALILVLVGGLIVGALLTYASGVIRATPTTEQRSTRVEAVKSAVRMAVTMQREVGPASCFSASSTYRVNGIDVAVTCTTNQVYSTGGGRYGVIATSSDPATVNVEGRGSGFAKEIDGAVFVNAGSLAGTTVDVMPKNAEVTLSTFTSAATAAARYSMTSSGGVSGGVSGSGKSGSGSGSSSVVACDATVVASDRFASGTTAAGTSVTHTTMCRPDAWWARAGDMNALGAFVYPPLPALPTYERPGSQATIGSCKVYYPGRYLGASPLVLSGGTHYFASGVYYFERPLQITGGAVVVVGEGKYAGCSYDAAAAFASTAPKNHEITGKGATLLFGGASTLSVSGNSTQLRLNRRVSSSSTRGSEGQSIRSVTTGTTGTVEAPADVVMRADGTTVGIASHSVQPSASSPAVKYTTSTIGATANIVKIDIGTSSVIAIDGSVFTPTAQVEVAGSTTQYSLRFGGGIVASRVRLLMNNAPTNPTTNWFVGVLSEPIQRQVTLKATATVNGRQVLSTATMEVNVDRSYAINNWTVTG